MIDFSGNNSYPRGLRNNNPGNLRYNSAIKWEGQTGQDSGGFAQFVSILYGIRAFGMDLSHDIRNGADTIEKLIYQYAPPSENDTEAYINKVAAAASIGRKNVLTPSFNTLLALAKGMFSVELGQQYADLIDTSDIRTGLGMIDNIGEKGSESNVHPMTILLVLAVSAGLIYFMLQ